ncbi:hypothetical protein E2986_00995 [Frieseomelitta varia]|uniref:Uncharacterized protein n=1 Tax=Frieseomelitta varia TaxID=561572 RepID=A0A833RHL9_9HYME|nr:hypothetical protein E2986_00995 [Frieseomelitta varia]
MDNNELRIEDETQNSHSRQPSPKLTVPATPEDTPSLPETPISEDIPRNILLQKDSSSEGEVDPETLYFRKYL